MMTALVVVMPFAGLSAAALASPALTRGPYVQLPSADGAMIVWNTDTPATCGVQVETFAGAPTTIAGEVETVCAMEVRGLAPGTLYRYRPLADGVALGAEGAFRTDHPALPYTFVVIGDSGSGSPAQAAVRDALLAHPAQFSLHTGDMVYPSALPHEWNTKHFTPYRQWLRKLVLWPAMGNHDVNGDSGVSWRDVFYTPANNAAAKEDYYSFDYGNAHVVVLDSNESLKPDAAQSTFLDGDLAATTATWKFVVFHHSIYSSGTKHGSDTVLREYLVPLFDAYGVDMVFMGHDHDYERTLPLRAGEIVGPGEGTVYITTGGGGGEVRPVGTSSYTAYAEAIHHFVRVSVAGESLELQMVRTDGSVGDSLTLTKGPAPTCGDGRVNQVGERCDGDDDAACPGGCDADCECPAACGDGVWDTATEECDWPDDGACPGRCIANCICADRPAVLEFEAVADTYIEAGAAATWDHGAATHLDVDTQPRRIVYLKFDVSGVTSPVERATVTLSCNNGSEDGGTAYPVFDSSWIEGTETGADEASAEGPGLKWSDVDTNGDGQVDSTDTSPYVPSFEQPIASMGGVEPDRVYMIEVTSAFQSGSGLYTLAIENDTSNGAAYASREDAGAAMRPLLRIELGLECRSDTDCADGLFCNGNEVCARGRCAAGSPVDCDDGTACTVDACDEAAGQCRSDPLADGTPCDDGDACTQTDACMAGSCVGADPVTCVALDQCHEAGECDPGTGLCSDPLQADGTPCDDGDACTQTDACMAGSCVGADPVTCVALDQCHQPGECDPRTGLCSDPQKADGNPCDDGDFCTRIDVCMAGQCEGGDAVVCAALDQCHEAGECDPATGLCANPAAANGTPCDDGDACTQTDFCVAGQCEGGDLVVCAALDQCHEAGECNPATGLCSDPAKIDGTSCDDGDACTQTDLCVAGQCEGGDAVVCVALDQCHEAGECNPATGLCAHPAAVNGTPCDDGDACTQTDRCVAGQCEGGDLVVCVALDQCHEAGECNPATGLCADPAKIDGTPCDDGDFCTQVDTCVAGRCTGAEPVTCAAPDQCFDAGTCDPATGQCPTLPSPDGTPCDDGDLCTQADFCMAGRCEGGDAVVCAAPDQCHEAGECNPATGLCAHPPKADGVPCDDGDFCTQADFCMAGRCEGADPVVCAAPGQCFDTGTCDPATGQCADRPKTDGTPCDDGDLCTQADFCMAGRCESGDPVVCAAPDQCHEAGECNPATGLCAHPAKADGVPCDDGDLCTQADFCMAGRCEGGDPVVCAALDQCHEAGECNPATGLCSDPAKVDGTPCDDGDFCTQTDFCVAGRCAGTEPVTCAAPDQCFDTGTCDPATGQCADRPKTDGTPCDDGDLCTQADFCMAGRCESGDAVVCAALDQCQEAGECNPATGLCAHPPKADGVPCDDGDACTQADACMAGSCVGADPVTCVALDQCHQPGECDPRTGQCADRPKTDGTPCDDGDLCTQTDVCVAGRCEGGDAVVCAAPGQCFDTGTCDPATGQCADRPKTDGTPCDDGDLCTQADFCVAGRCEGGDPVVCVATDSCHDAGVCEAATGLCSVPAKPDGTPCDDSLFCTMGDACQMGACVGEARDCSMMGGQCTEAVCDEATDKCTAVSKTDGTGCDDGAFCTVGDVCQQGVCVGTPRDCVEGTPCLVGSCDEAARVCVTSPRPDDTACDDGAFCTVDDVCRDGVCVGASRDCAAAGDDCNDGVCDEANDACAARPKANGTTCNDQMFCTVDDTCTDGTCQGRLRDCSARGDQCHDGVCDGVAEACVSVPKQDGAVCDDENACTRSDVCREGECRGEDPVQCPAAGQCHEAGVCNPATGRCAMSTKPEGSPCDDGSQCTENDRCVDGQCVGTDLVDGDGDGTCDAVDVCPLVADPEQWDGDSDGVGDACQCSAPSPGRCIPGGGSKRADCLLEFMPTGQVTLNRSRTKVKPIIRCRDGDAACDLDQARDGKCTFGVALCFGSRDPRYPLCTAAPIRGVEVLRPNAGRRDAKDSRDNGERLEEAVAKLGLEVRRRGRVIVPPSAPGGSNICSPVIRLLTPAPGLRTKKPVRRTFKLRAETVDGRRDKDRFVLECRR